MADKAFVYEGIKQSLKQRIDSGELAEGARIPSEYALARELGVSRNQTRQALRELEIEGYVVRQRGSGSFVAPRQNRMVHPVPEPEKTVALLFPRFLSGYSRNVVSGFMQGVATSGYQTVVYNVQCDEASEPGMLRSVSESGVAGVAAWIEHNNETCRALIRELTQRAFPVVLLDRALSSVEVDSVTSDHEELGYRLTKALIDRGHRRIAFIGTERGNPTSVNDRQKGYFRALEESGVLIDNRLASHIREQVYDEASGVAAELMGLYDRPTAVFCLHDLVAYLLYRELLKMGYKIPEHVELAADEGHHPPPHDEMPLISVEQRGLEIGSTGADLLLSRIADPVLPARQIRIPPSGVTANYTACATTETREHVKEGGETPLLRRQN